MSVSKIAFGTHFVFEVPSEDKRERKQGGIAQAARRLGEALNSQKHPENTLIHVVSPLTRNAEVRLIPHPSEVGKFRREIYWFAPALPVKTNDSSPSKYASASFDEIDAILNNTSISQNNPFSESSQPSQSSKADYRIQSEGLASTPNYFSLLDFKSVDKFLNSLNNAFAQHFRTENIRPSISRRVEPDNAKKSVLA